MNIHEHQAKELLKEFNAPISNGIVIAKTKQNLERKRIIISEFINKSFSTAIKITVTYDHTKEIKKILTKGNSLIEKFIPFS